MNLFLVNRDAADPIRQMLGVIGLKKEEAVQKVEDDIKTENEIHEGIVDNLEEKKEAVETGAVNPEDVLNSQPKTEEGKEVTKNACSDEVKNECGDEKTVQNSEDETKEDKEDKVETETDDKKDDDKEETVDEDDDKKDEEKKVEKKEEVIPLEALNSAPKTDGVDIVKGGTKSWQKLSGKEFIDWVNNGMK